MKITYISHATLLIEAEGIKLVTDPWVIGPAYCNQWHLFPRPVNAERIADADYVIYSHGHEDHLHAQSLQTVNKRAEVFYPYSWYSGTKEFIQSLGFEKAGEVLNEHTIDLGGKLKVTWLSNNLDNVVVIESRDTVLVNVNDALPSASASMIAHFISKINRRWKKIDYVFASYGGAAYFPNAVHYVHKNDREIGEARELFFVTNFCKIAAGLKPKMAVPFATDFVLLDDRQRWINEIKFPRDKIKALFKTNFPQSTSQVIEAYSGDFFENLQFHQRSPYHGTDLLASIDSVYKTEIEEKRTLQPISSRELTALFEKVKAHILNKQYIIPEETRRKITFGLRISDAGGDNILVVDFRSEPTGFTLTGTLPTGLDLLIESKSQTIHYSLDNEWGGDSIIIGYGAEVTIYNEDAILYEYENYCVRLLSRYPNTKEYLKKEPLRAIKYLLSDSIKRNNLLNRALRKKDRIVEYTDPLLGNRDLWLNKPKCDVCKACNL